MSQRLGRFASSVFQMRWSVMPERAEVGSVDRPVAATYAVLLSIIGNAVEISSSLWLLMVDFG